MLINFIHLSKGEVKISLFKGVAKHISKIVDAQPVYECLAHVTFFFKTITIPNACCKVNTSERTHLNKRVCPSVRPSVTPVQKPRFLAVFGHGEIIQRNNWSTNMFWEPPLLLSRIPRLFVYLSLHICHMINTRSDTVRTHRCPVGLDYVLFAHRRACFSNGKPVQ